MYIQNGSTYSEMMNLAATFTTYLANDRSFWHVSQKVFNTLKHASNDVHIKENTSHILKGILDTKLKIHICLVHF